MRVFPAVLVLTAALTACAQPKPLLDSGAAPPPDEQRIGQHSLEPWRDFPVDADPRPIVLLGELAGVEGFTTGEAKLAFVNGQIDPAGNVPPEAEAAFKRLTKPADGTTPVRVLSTTKGTATFATDRGVRELPAWWFRLTDAIGDIAVLAEQVQWHRPRSAPGAHEVSVDGLTLMLTLPKPPAACPGEPTRTAHAEALESPTAVAVGLRTELGPPAPGERQGQCVQTLMLEFAEYPVTLDKPLGNRVLVDAQGNPMPVS
jgi:hypothetical protein